VNGVAVKGLLIRHLVLPGGGAGTEKVLEFIANEISPGTYVSLMSQYFPAHNAMTHPILNRRITQKEYQVAVNILHRLGLENGWIQPYYK
jgi:putative pyruvate formate lyase activating enzyme